jgi:four helix bundle protein
LGLWPGLIAWISVQGKAEKDEGTLGNSRGVKTHADLIVWQRAIQMTLAIYKLSQEFPREEIYGLTSQIRRASVSVASNVAEGYGRGSRGEYKQFLGIARWSNCEVQTQLVIAKELGYGKEDQRRMAADLSNEVSLMLHALIAKLAHPKSPTT